MPEPKMPERDLGAMIEQSVEESGVDIENQIEAAQKLTPAETAAKEAIKLADVGEKTSREIVAAIDACLSKKGKLDDILKDLNAMVAKYLTAAAAVGADKEQAVKVLSEQLKAFHDSYFLVDETKAAELDSFRHLMELAQKGPPAETTKIYDVPKRDEKVAGMKDEDIDNVLGGLG